MWKMKSSWFFLCAACIWYPIHGTVQSSTTCSCHGNAQYCRQDHLGELYCINCQRNTEGRHCENCKEGYHHQRAGDNCVPCNCNTAGSLGPFCNNEGRCACKQGFYGGKCDRCDDGSQVTPNGCKPLRLSCRSRNNGRLTYNPEECLPCFCNGHSSVCSSADGYSVHNITSTFENGPEGWRAATGQGVSSSQVQFRWSPTHKDLEVISKEILPVYLFAPASYLGNKALSYSQTLTFSLRLDRGVRRPSISDVMLEGAGLKVSASLGDLRTVVPCGKKIAYTFKLDEQPGSKWKPQLSSTEFQTLLSNLTAIKIRGTFGENGRGYLDDVSLVSAKLGPGTPADWVEKCRCPVGYDGLFCERCATGYRRRFPGQGPRSPCDPCSCQGGACDPETGGCYSADEIPNLQMCPKGYYVNRQQSNSCQKCPCPEGEACYVIPVTQDVMCARCPRGTTGSRCEICDDGFYGDPLGEYGPPKQCQPCQCNGHVDQNAIGNCDRRTGECRKCLNHSNGPKCENCEDGYHHIYPTDPCQACNCNRLGSVSNSCSDKGQCECKEGYDGLKCEKSTCPSCFNPVKSKIEVYARQLQEMEDLFKGIGGDDAPVNDALMEQAIRAAEVMVQTLKLRANELTSTEKQLQDKLASISRSQLREDRNMEALLTTLDGVRNKDQRYRMEVSEISDLISVIRLKLQQAKRDIQQAEFPSGDGVPGADSLFDLVQRAADLAEQHQGEAVTVETIAANSLTQSEKALDLIRGVINRENKVKDQVKDLKRLYEADVNKVLDMENKATKLTDTAGKESEVAQNTLKQLSDLEKKLPKPLTKDIAGVVSMFDNLKGMVEGNLSQYQDFQQYMLSEQKETADLFNKAKTFQQVQDKLLARANAAEAVKNKSLEIFANNKDSLEKTLATLKDFDDQIGGNKDLADAAIAKLPAINYTIQKAIADNTKTQDILDAMAPHYRDAQDTIDSLTSTATKLEGMSDSLPPSSDILEAATKLKEDVDGLNIQAALTRDRLNEEKNKAKEQINQAKNAIMESTGALGNAKNARDAVSDTLKTITDIMGSLGTPGTVDDKRVADLETAIAKSRNRVETELRPRLRELEEKEAQQRASISGMINDIDTILADIANLEEIRKSIPNGCYNIPPIERP
ncbi:laminin subunit gamma-2 [Pimephales promelas]|uniref:laminin subunit gamma-2 n=1 Tax=Pimephales promelas TaxID=90988 RepID=UPI0019554D97|nr:laminin subunit gamma-2 [Pimephales promelas]KAG1934783.1 laminin subunit gamma-1 [Pimephales promelas]